MTHSSPPYTAISQLIYEQIPPKDAIIRAEPFPLRYMKRNGFLNYKTGMNNIITTSCNSVVAVVFSGTLPTYGIPDVNRLKAPINKPKPAPRGTAN